MSTPPLVALFMCLAVVSASAIEIDPIPHRVVTDDRTFVRDTNDRRYSIWTDSDVKISEIVTSLGLPKMGVIQLKPGEVFAVFLNDRIEEDLVQVAHNRSTKQYFADYADSGIEFRIRPLSADKKYSHLTVVVFSPSQKPSHLGMRGMILNGISEKK